MRKRDKQQRIERLTQAIRVLEALPPEAEFNLGTWGLRNRQTHCMTAGCVAGWCGNDSWFKRRGFSLIADTRNSALLVPTCKANGQVFTGHAALLKFFKLSRYQTDSIFYHEGYPEVCCHPTKAQVIERLHQTIQELEGALR